MRCSQLQVTVLQNHTALCVTFKIPPQINEWNEQLVTMIVTHSMEVM